MKFRFLVTFDVPTDFRNKHSVGPEDIADWQGAVEKAVRDLIPTLEGAVWVERFEDEMDWREKPTSKSARGWLMRFRDFSEKRPLQVVVFSFLAGYFGWWVASLLKP